MIRMKTGIVFVFAAVALPMLSGCLARPHKIESEKPNYILFIPGILGQNIFELSAARAVADGSPDASTQFWDWTLVDRPVWQRIFSPLGIDNLTEYSRNRRRATQLAAALTEWRSVHKDDKLYVVAISGGVGLLAFACEELPSDFKFDRIVLISGALSRDYDFDNILAHSADGLFNYYSEDDRFVLGRGTRTYGNMDRRCADAIGKIGIHDPANPKIRQLEWTPAMQKLGNDGGHAGGLAAKFLKTYVSPLFDDDPSNDPSEWIAN